MPVCAAATEHKGAHLMTPYTSRLTKAAPTYIHTEQFAYLDTPHFAGHLLIPLK